MQGKAEAVLNKARRRVFRSMVRHLNTSRWAKITRELADMFEAKEFDEYVRKTDFTKLDVSNYPVRHILAGKYTHHNFHVGFYFDMIAIIVHCLQHEELPCVSVQWMGEKDKVWERFLEQPYHECYSGNYDEITRACRVVAPPLQLPRNPTQEDVEVYSKLFRAPFFVLNEKTRAYIEGEYEEIFKKRGEPRVCGVLCRGTDYTIGTKGLAIQPEIPQMIEHVRQKMEELNCEYIYLATEEYRIQKMFDAAFPNKVLINKRKYYDSFWEIRKEKGNRIRIGNIYNDRENDGYYKSLEYLSSLVLLSRCQALIAGRCGGSLMSLYMNGGKYEYWHIYNLGTYS